MTTNEITETLTEVRDAVVVPPVDELAFQRLVVRERRRRTTGRVLVASAAAVVLAAGVGLAVQLDAPDAAPSVGTPEQDRAVYEPMSEPIPYLRSRELQVLLPDGSSVDAGVRAQEVLGLTDGGVVTFTFNSGLVVFPLRTDGTIGQGKALTDGTVQRAWLSKDRKTIGWVDLGNVVHLRQLGAEQDSWSGRLSSPQQELFAVDGDHWVEGDRDRLALRYVDVALDVKPVDGVSVVELAGQTLAVGGLEGVEFFSAVDGSPTYPGGIGGSHGALSPDGSRYAAGYPAHHVEHGASQILEVIDTSNGSMKAITGIDYDGVLDVSWTGDNFLALIIDEGKYSVVECSAEALACDELIEPTTAPLQLPSS